MMIIKCEKCDDLGVIHALRKDDSGNVLERRRVPCPACEAGQEYADLLWSRSIGGSAGLPVRYQALTFDSWQALPEKLKAKKQAAYWACLLMSQSPDLMVSDEEIEVALGYDFDGQARRANSLVLTSPVGMGKTGLIAALKNALFKRGIPVLYSRADDMLREIQERYSRHDDNMSAKALQLVYSSATVLAVDELTFDETTTDQRRILESIFRFRHARKLPTLITTNWGKSEMERYIGERVTSVIWDTSHVIELAGASLREDDPVIRD